MKRTTVFLPDTLHENLRREAFRARVSMAEIIRLRLELGSRPAGKPRDPLAKAEGAVRNGRLRQNIDEALYRDGAAATVRGHLGLDRAGTTKS